MGGGCVGSGRMQTLVYRSLDGWEGRYEGYRWAEVVLGVGGCKHWCIGRWMGRKEDMKAIDGWRGL